MGLRELLETCQTCGHTGEDVRTTYEHVGGYSVDQPVTHCRDEVKCWQRWDEQHKLKG